MPKIVQYVTLSPIFFLLRILLGVYFPVQLGIRNKPIKKRQTNMPAQVRKGSWKPPILIKRVPMKGPIKRPIPIPICILDMVSLDSRGFITFKIA